MSKPLLDSHQQTTFFVVLAVSVVLIVYDALVKYYWGGSATISWTFAMLSREYPVFPLAFGLLLGHLFLVRWAPNLWSWRALAAILAGLAVGATFIAQKPTEEPRKEG